MHPTIPGWWARLLPCDQYGYSACTRIQRAAPTQLCWTEDRGADVSVQEVEPVINPEEARWKWVEAAIVS